LYIQNARKANNFELNGTVSLRREKTQRRKERVIFDKSNLAFLGCYFIQLLNINKSYYTFAHFLRSDNAHGTVAFALINRPIPEGQHYPPGTQENCNSFSSRDLMMEKGKELECSRRAGDLIVQRCKSL